MSKEKRDELQQKAIVETIARKDKDLARLVEELFANQFNLANLSPKDQQLYVDQFSATRSESKEMKKFDELFSSM